MSRSELAMTFAASTVEWARQELELTIQEIAKAVGASRKTVQRWRERLSAPSAQHRRQLERLNQLKHLLDSSFRTSDDARRWMHQSVPGLQGRTPFFVLASGDVDSVIKVLGTLAAGAHR